MPRYNFDYNENNLMHARDLRKNMTSQEKKLWYQFLHKYPVRFYRQRRIADYIVDFYCASEKLVIEIDGGQHYDPEAMEADERRSKALNDLGIRVIRFTNTDINSRFTAVCEEIDRIVKGEPPSQLR